MLASSASCEVSKHRYGRGLQGGMKWRSTLATLVSATPGLLPLASLATLSKSRQPIRVSKNPRFAGNQETEIGNQGEAYPPGVVGARDLTEIR